MVNYSLTQIEFPAPVLLSVATQMNAEAAVLTEK